MDDLEVEDTKKLFLEQGAWEAKQKKEMQEYLDAKNKEVKSPPLTRALLCSALQVQGSLHHGGDAPDEGGRVRRRGRRGGG